MDRLIYSLHAHQRMQQRGLRKQDINLVLKCGTQVNKDSFLLSKKDAERAIRQRKREIQALERLRGAKIVIREGVVVTCLRTTDSQTKTSLRRAH